MKILVTGSCGFIGSHLCEKLLKIGDIVLGVDNMNEDIYSFSYKEENQYRLMQYKNYIHKTDDLLERNNVLAFEPNIVIHLAGYANVRKSEEMPEKFVENNVEVTTLLLHDIALMKNKPLFIYASSSSVYGNNQKVPFSEKDACDNIVSPYALTKKMCEDIVSLYCRTKKIRAIGLRFFTVYGPRGRPDMAIMTFLKNIRDDKPITVYQDKHVMDIRRDFTYIDDIVEGIYSCLFLKIEEGGHEIYNLGSDQCICLEDVIRICEEVCGKRAIVEKKPKPDSDVLVTYADNSKAKRDLGYSPRIGLKEGVYKTHEWLNKKNY
jgi:UDP-glucuronate 4-epimerase